MGFDEESSGMSMGSNDGSEVVEVPQEDVAKAATTTENTPNNNDPIESEYYDKLGADLKRKHEVAASKVVLPVDVKTARHKEVWYMGLRWEHAKRRALHLPPLLIKTPEEHHVWNRAREALKKKKEAIKKIAVRAAKCSKKQKITTCKGHGEEGDIEGHHQEDDFVASNENIIKCSASAAELARLVHVMADDDSEEALQQLVTGFQTRQVIDDKMGRILPWQVFSTLFNDPKFLPTNHFHDDENSVERLREIDPSVLERKVDDKKLKGEHPTMSLIFFLVLIIVFCVANSEWWLAAKGCISKLEKRYHSSGRMGTGSEVAKWKFCNGNMGT